jgi:hypothetical protein
VWLGAVGSQLVAGSQLLAAVGVGSTAAWWGKGIEMFLWQVHKNGISVQSV